MAFHWKIEGENTQAENSGTIIRNRLITQSNIVSILAKVPGLEVVETLTSKKHADLLNTCFAEYGRKLKVMVQLNMSKKEGKNGLEENEIYELAGKICLQNCYFSGHNSMFCLYLIQDYIIKSCSHLEFIGLMTSGELSDSVASSEPNPDFDALVKYRRYIDIQIL